MRLPFLLATLLGVGGCTISPTTFNIADPEVRSIGRIVLIEQQNHRRWPEVAESDVLDVTNTSPPLTTVEGPINLPERTALPELPTFTEEELSDPDVVESKLVSHIVELRNHISSYYRTLEEFETEALEFGGRE